MMQCNIVCLICLFWMSAAAGYAQTPDLQQLKAKLQQLDQTMQELKRQIASVEASENAPGAPVVAATPQPSRVSPPQLPTTYIGLLTRTREVANQDPEGAARLDAEDVDPSLRGFFRLPGTGTLIRLGGFVKTDIFVDANQAGTYSGGYAPSSVPSSPQPHTVNATVSMRPSRFCAEYRQPAGGDRSSSVNAYLESPSALNSVRQSVLPGWPDLIGFCRYENNRGHPQFAFLSRSVGGATLDTLVPDLKNHVNGGRE